MSKEELIEFLKENLKIKVSTDYDLHKGPCTIVSLKLLGETISSGTIYRNPD